MTVNTTSIVNGPYSGDGVTTDFSYTFNVDEVAEIRVFETDAAGIVTELVAGTDFTASGLGTKAGGGLVTRVAGALPTGYTWYIRANYAQTQLSAFSSQGGFYPEVHEYTFDHITYLIQQLQDVIDRGISLPLSYPLVGVDMTLPYPTAGGFVIGYDSAGTGFTLYELGSSLGTVAADIHAAAEKITIADADEIGIADSGVGAGYGLKHVLFSTIKSTLQTAFETYFSGLSTTWAISTTGNSATSTLADVVKLQKVALAVNTTIDSTYQGKLIESTSSPTLTFDTPVNLGANFWCYIRNDDTGTTALATTGAANVMQQMGDDGGLVSSFNLPDARTGANPSNNEFVLITCDGATITVHPISIPSGRQIFTANGNFTVPKGVTRIWVRGITGGGGGGGAVFGSTASWEYGAGGGEAGKDVGLLGPFTVVPLSTYAVSLSGGAGGTGGTAANANNATAGVQPTYSLGALFSINGGAGGFPATSSAQGAGGGSGGGTGSGTNGSGNGGGSGNFGTGAGGNGGNLFGIWLYGPSAGGIAGGSGGGGGGGGSTSDATGGAGGRWISGSFAGGGGGGGAGHSPGTNGSDFASGAVGAPGGSGGDGIMIIEW